MISDATAVTLVPSAMTSRPITIAAARHPYVDACRRDAISLRRSLHGSLWIPPPGAGRANVNKIRDEIFFSSLSTGTFHTGCWALLS